MTINMNINKLPMEILMHIFSALRDEQTNIWGCSDPWIVVTHVCRRWRSVALEAAELWTKIHAGRDDVVSAYVQRSKQAPLEITYTYNLLFQFGEFTKPVWDILTPQSHRMRDIVVCVNDAVYPFFQHLLSNGAPLLVSAELKFSSMTPTFNVGQTQIIDDEDHGHGFPALRNLSVAMWPNIGIPSLRTLVKPSLCSLTIDMPLRPLSPSVWASVLKDLPLLENLVLTEALAPLSSPSKLRMVPTIGLPRLISLTIRDSHPDEQVMLLQRIQPARDVCINFFVCSPPNHDPLDFPVAPFVQALSEKYTTRFHDASSPTLLEFELTTEKDRTIGRGTGIRVKLAATVNSITCPEYESIDATPVLDIDLRGLRPSPDDVCRPICDMLSTICPLSAVRTLSLYHGSKTVPGSWRDIFLQMIHLDTIFIKRNRNSRIADDLVSMLAVSKIQPSDTTGPAVSSRQILFPTLRLVSIQEHDGSDNINFDLLLKVLQSRKKAGHGISSIHICPPLLRPDREEEMQSQLLEFKTSLDCHAYYCVLVDLSEALWKIESL